MNLPNHRNSREVKLFITVTLGYNGSTRGASGGPGWGLSWGRRSAIFLLGLCPGYRQGEGREIHVIGQRSKINVKDIPKFDQYMYLAVISPRPTA
jgi:hypothetical protein